MTTSEAIERDTHGARNIDVIYGSQANHALGLIDTQPPAPDIGATRVQQKLHPSALTDTQLRLIMQREAAQHIDDAFSHYLGPEERAALGLTGKQFEDIRMAATLAVAEFGVDVHNGDISYAPVSLPKVPPLDSSASSSSSEPKPTIPPNIIRGEE